MNKFKRYLAVVFCFLLLTLFIPGPYANDSESGYGAEYPDQLTPFDKTVITKLGMWGSSDWKLWRYATSYKNTCTDDLQIERSSYGRPIGLCSEFGLAVSLPVLSYYWKNMQEFLKLEPSLLEKHEAVSKAEEHNKNFSDKEQHRKKEYQELNEVSGRAIVKYLESTKDTISAKIYIINLGLIVFIVLGVFCRQALGNLLWMPFSLIGRVFITSATTAKGLHDKI